MKRSLRERFRMFVIKIVTKIAMMYALRKVKKMQKQMSSVYDAQFNLLNNEEDEKTD